MKVSLVPGTGAAAMVKISSSASWLYLQLLIFPNPYPMLRWEIWHPAPGIQNQFIEIIICLMTFSASAQKWLASAHGRMPFICWRLPTRSDPGCGRLFLPWCVGSGIPNALYGLF